MKMDIIYKSYNMNWEAINPSLSRNVQSFDFIIRPTCDYKFYYVLVDSVIEVLQNNTEYHFVSCYYINYQKELEACLDEIIEKVEEHFIKHINMLQKEKKIDIFFTPYPPRCFLKDKCKKIIQSL